MKHRIATGSLHTAFVGSMTIASSGYALTDIIDNRLLQHGAAYITIRASIPEGTTLGKQVYINLLHLTPLGWASQGEICGTITAESEGEFSITFGSISLRNGEFRFMLRNELDTQFFAEVAVETGSQEFLD